MLLYKVASRIIVIYMNGTLMHSGNLFNHQTGFKQSSRRDSTLQYQAPSRIIGISMTLLGVRSGNLFRTTYCVYCKRKCTSEKGSVHWENSSTPDFCTFCSDLQGVFPFATHNYWMYNPGICNHTGWLLSVKNAAQKRQTTPAHRYGY